jgi:hypothetical protein
MTRLVSRRRLPLALLLGVSAAFAFAGTAGATLQLNRPDASVPATFVGKGGYSSDGIGQTEPGGTVQAEVPAGSTVKYAFLYGTYNTNDPNEGQRTIRVDSTDVVTTKISEVSFLSTTRADVTSLVAAKVGSGGGITNFQINSDPGNLDGVALVVIFSNPALPQTTVAVLDGSASQTGDTATFNFAQPIDKTQPGFNASLTLGSGFSYQGAEGHVCGPIEQFSTVNINEQLLTNCAGSYDDGEGVDDALLTVGGVGDSLDNPTPPDAPATDDELYNLVPFLKNGDTSLEIKTSNPSQDDNLFLAVIATSAQAAVTTEVCDDNVDNDGDGRADGADPDCFTISLSPATATNPVGQPHTVTATVGGNDPDTSPNGKKVLFTVAGANTASGSGTVSGGQAQFTYTGNNAGNDTITGCLDVDGDNTCDADEPKATAQKTYQQGGGEPSVDGRMVSNAKRLGATFASNIDCPAATANARNRPFQVQWNDGGAKSFKLTSVTTDRCFNDPSFTPSPPPATMAFDTQTGTGAGTVNGQPGYTIEWRLEDHGAPSPADAARLKITRNSDNSVVLDVPLGPLSSGQNFALPPV